MVLFLLFHIKVVIRLQYIMVCFHRLSYSANAQDPPSFCELILSWTVFICGLSSGLTIHREIWFGFIVMERQVGVVVCLYSPPILAQAWEASRNAALLLPAGMKYSSVWGSGIVVILPALAEMPRCSRAKIGDYLSWLH